MQTNFPIFFINVISHFNKTEKCTLESAHANIQILSSTTFFETKAKCGGIKWNIVEVFAFSLVLSFYRRCLPLFHLVESHSLIQSVSQLVELKSFSVHRRNNVGCAVCTTSVIVYHAACHSVRICGKILNEINALKMYIGCIFKDPFRVADLHADLLYQFYIFRFRFSILGNLPNLNGFNNNKRESDE